MAVLGLADLSLAGLSARAKGKRCRRSLWAITLKPRTASRSAIASRTFQNDDTKLSWPAEPRSCESYLPLFHEIGRRKWGVDARLERVPNTSPLSLVPRRLRLSDAGYAYSLPCSHAFEAHAHKTPPLHEKSTQSWVIPCSALLRGSRVLLVREKRVPVLRSA